MLIGELMAGAALGLALQMLHEAIKRAKDRSLTTRSILNRLDDTIVRISPLVVQVGKLSERVDDSERKVIKDLKHLLEDAVSLVGGYAELRRRNLRKKYRYKRRIKELEAELRWMVDVDVQVMQMADIKELIAKVSEMNTKVDKITCQPTDCNCFKTNHSIASVISQSSSQNITDRSSEEDEESSRDGPGPKFDIHLRWSSRKQSKDHEIRFVFK